MSHYSNRSRLETILDEAGLTKLGKLSDEESVLVALILEHGLVTKATWISIADGERRVETFSNAMWTLTRRKLVVARPLFQGTMYFSLSKAVVSKLNLPSVRATSFDAAAKLNAYARLLLFTHYLPKATQIRKAQLAQQLGQPVIGLPTGFFGRLDEPGWLGFLRVDGHMRGAPSRSARSIRDDVHRLIQIVAIRTKLKQRQFGWVWITARQSRADVVLEHFKKFDVGRAPVEAVVMPELLSIVNEQKEFAKRQ